MLFVNAKANVLMVLCSLRMCGYFWEKQQLVKDFI